MGSPDDLTGALIANKYELLRPIGRGGMGVVYEARNRATLRRCAVKVLLSPELAGDSEIVRRFFREARASGMIESDHVVAAFDSGIDDAGHAFYVMECLLGEDLEQTLERLGQLSPLAALKVVLQATTGLASAHALGIVHRDVKPANLFLALYPGGEVKVKILDFGVAKVKMELFNESNHTLTQSGSLLGTPLYMSPEQLRRASAIDESADIWSLGVVLFECLTGQLPWGEFDGIGELVTAILTSHVPNVQDLAPWIEPGVADVVQRALSRDRAFRLDDAAELRKALLELVNGDARLFVEEIRKPDEQQRRSLAPRLTMPDTVMIGPPAYSGAPLVSSILPKPRGRRWPLLAAVALVPLGMAWFRVGPPPNRGARPHDDAVSNPAASAPVPLALASSGAAPSATPAPAGGAPSGRFALRVGPAGVSARIDGVPTPVARGEIVMEGVPGTLRELRLSYLGATSTTRIQVTERGLSPERVVLPIRAKTPGPSTMPRPSPSLSASSTIAPSPPPVSTIFR